MSAQDVTVFRCDFCPARTEKVRGSTLDEEAVPEGWHSLDVDRLPAVGRRLHVCTAHPDLTVAQVVELVEKQMTEQSRRYDGALYPGRFSRSK